MAFFSEILACLSLVIISAAEVVSPSSLRIGAILVAIAVALLLASFTRSSWILSLLLSACVGGYATVRHFRGRVSTSAAAAAAAASVNGGIKSQRANCLSNLRALIVRLIPPALATLFHVLALWILPFCILYGFIDAQSDSEFFGQEVGHIAPATFYVVGLVALPLLILPPGYQKATTVHQMWESIFNTAFSLIYFCLFRTVHHFRGQDPPQMSAPNWDHEFLGLVFFGAGIIGIIMALQDIRTSIHVSFPTAFVAFSMLSHSNAHHTDMANVDSWKRTWMKLHAVHGMLFGLGALCRLIDRVPESLFFFYIGSFAFVTSAQYVVQVMDEAVNYEDDPESAKAGRAYPTDHVVPLLVVTVATVMYALFLGTATRLRMFLNRDAEVAGDRGTFEALPTSEEPALDFDKANSTVGNGDGASGNGIDQAHPAGILS